MLSGGKAGLVSGDLLRKEQEENRRKEKHNQPLEGWFCFFNPLSHCNFVTTHGNFDRQCLFMFQLIAIDSTFKLLCSYCFKHHIPAVIDESRNAETVFRDKSGKRRDLESEREEQRKKAEEKAIKDEKYAQWGIG